MIHVETVPLAQALGPALNLRYTIASQPVNRQITDLTSYHV